MVILKVVVCCAIMTEVSNMLSTPLTVMVDNRYLANQPTPYILYMLLTCVLLPGMSRKVVIVI